MLLLCDMSVRGLRDLHLVSGRLLLSLCRVDRLVMRYLLALD
jgi:hypothetical protein